jgi:hypothetical protein
VSTDPCWLAGSLTGEVFKLFAAVGHELWQVDVVEQRDAHAAGKGVAGQREHGQPRVQRVARRRMRAVLFTMAQNVSVFLDEAESYSI